MRPSDTTYHAIATPTGYAVECRQPGQPVFFCGRDGYWCRAARNANPFSTFADAVAAANRMDQ